MESWYRWQDGNLILTVKVQPRASKDEIAGIYQGALKIRITAPPVDGKANRHLIAYLSKVFKVPKSAIELLSGQSGRDKRLCIRNPETLPEQVRPETPDTDSTGQNP